jgi:hypothetical protein
MVTICPDFRFLAPPATSTVRRVTAVGNESGAWNTGDRMEETFPGSGETPALRGLRCDFIVASRRYRNCSSEETKKAIVVWIDDILDKHTQLEVTLGLLAIAELTS